MIEDYILLVFGIVVNHVGFIIIMQQELLKKVKVWKYKIYTSTFVTV